MNVSEKRRWKEIDVLYTIGIILVLIGHSHSSDWSTFRGTVLDKAIIFIYTFHMPLFFFISGFLFQNSKAIEAKGYKSWIFEKAIRLLSPYLLWSLIAAVPKYWVENRSFAGVGKAIIDVFINPRASVWGHFWFLPVLFLTYMIFGAVRRVASSAVGEKKMIVGLLATTLIFYFLPINTPILGLADLHTVLFFFAVGMSMNSFLSKKTIIIPRWGGILWIVVVTAACVYLTPQSYNSSILALLVALLMISVCWTLATMISVKGWISSHNFTVYIFSWLFQAVVMAVCDRTGLGWIPTFFLMFTAGFLGPALVIVVYERFSFLHKRFIRLVLGMRGKTVVKRI